mmetsp:Transcript_34351/g.74163  ORF Transcript_34351/g.74163 Transcript_34351/m.74163 type:complete len:123 (+) Transcript_34351:1117-1485(+)
MLGLQLGQPAPSAHTLAEAAACAREDEMADLWVWVGIASLRHGAWREGARAYLTAMRAVGGWRRAHSKGTARPDLALDRFRQRYGATVAQHLSEACRASESWTCEAMWFLLRMSNQVEAEEQ